jgi:hypothetical protein
MILKKRVMKTTIRGFKPYKKQKEIIDSIINEDAKYYTVCTGRQCGKSLIIENLVYYFLCNMPGSFNGVISPTYKQVMKIFKSCINRLNKTNIMKSYNKSDKVIELVNGSSVQFFSADNYDAIRGNTFSGCLLIDEAAFIKDEAWEQAIKATTLVKCKKVCFFSTPRGKNWFYNVFMNTGNRYRSFRFSSYDSPFIDKEELEEYKKSLPNMVYRQEILAEFIEDNSDVFRNVNELCILNENITNREKYFIGIDLGNKQDWTVISIFNRNKEQVALWRFKKNDWNEIVDEIIIKLRGLKDWVAYVESNGVGSPIFDRLRREFNNKIKEFITNNTNKEEIINNLIFALDNREIRLQNNTFLKNEMDTFTFVFSKNSGKIMYGARNGFNDDTVMATAIAYNCLNKNKQERSIIYEKF